VAVAARQFRIIEERSMSDQQGADPKVLDPNELSQTMAKIAEQSQRIVGDFLSRQGTDGMSMADPLSIGRTFMEMTARLMADPSRLVSAHMSLWQDYMNLWQATARRMMGQEADAVAEAAPEDRRFRDPAWQENQLFDFIKQSYLLSARWLQSTVSEVDGLDDKTAKKVDFYTASSSTPWRPATSC
jgi:polyhydroxyalkanoate synthase